jgi:6-phosphogluconolactonase
VLYGGIIPPMRKWAFAALLAASAVPVGLAQPAAPSQGRIVLVGTYTGPDSQGIYAFRFDDRAGTLAPLGLAAETANPSFLAASPDRRFVFAVNEVDAYGGERQGSVSSFSLDAVHARLTPLSVQASRGANPCHLAVDRTGRFLAVANYTSGNFALLPVGADGRLGPAVTVLTHTGSGPNVDRQEGPHAHAVVFDASNRFLIGSDLGLDRLFVYRFAASRGAVTPGDPPATAVAPGSGPRHFAFHPTRPLAFSINELASTITSYDWDAATGRLTTLGTYSTLPAGATVANTTAELAVHPTGRFLYGSNRGHDSIAAFRIDGHGTLTLVGVESTRGATPRHFAIDPGGRWLLAANQQSGTVSVFRIDQATGALTPSGPLSQVGSPVCLLFLN